MRKILLSIVIIAVSFTIDGQVGIGTTSPEGALDIVSTTTGVVFPRVANAAAVTTPVNGMAVYDLSLNCFNFYENGVWSGCRYALPTTTYCTGSATTIVDVTNPTTGKTWMDRNLGATQAATSSSDAASYGDLYQWGRFTDGHQCRTSASVTSTSAVTTVSGINTGKFLKGSQWYTGSNPDALWQGVDGTNNPCPSGYRLPTETELNNERLSWGSNNAAGALGSPLKLSIPGVRFEGDGTLNREGTHGHYWSSTVSGANTIGYLYVLTSEASISPVASDASGMSVRCTKNVDNPPPTPVYCTGSPTTIVDVTNPVTGKTWMDRNLGATQAATSSTDTASYGDLYQWGRAADGHQCRTSGTRVALATNSTPEHGDFILSPDSPYDWLTPQDGTLWQGVDGTNNPCPSGYRLPTETELNNERLSWGSNNAAGALGSLLKLPITGYRSRSNGSLTNVGTYGYYWSDTVSSANTANTSNLFLGNSDAGIDSNTRARGFAVRCTKNVDNPLPITYCTGSATTIVDVTNPTTGKTWMDRNLGATQAATSATDAASYGDLYQWGRFTDGHQCRTSGTTTVLATNSTPEHGDFIQSQSIPYDWLTPQDDTLWQGVDGINNPCPSGYRIPTSTELNNERLSWGFGGIAAAFDSPLKFSVGGYRNFYSGDYGPGTGKYWSATVSNANYMSYLSILTTRGEISYSNRAYGMSVRCTKNIDNPFLYCTGSATAIVDVTNPITGKTWMDRNLGATQAALSSTDSDAYGDLYQWGRFTDGHQCRTSGTTTTLATNSTPIHGDFIVSPASPNDWLTPQDDNLWQGVDGINNPCPSGYRIPTETELNNERLSWDSNNGAGAFGSPLKLPVTGYRNTNGTLTNVDSYGYYWSETVSSANGANTSNLFLGNSVAGVGSNLRAYGFAVRCTKNTDNPPPTPVYCTGSPTTIVDVTNPTTGKTWMDRNLGATQAATSSTDAAAYGDLYQWGRFTDGHQCRDSSETTVLATNSTPEHSDFIRSSGSPNDWLTPHEFNTLWQGVDGVNNPCPSGYRIPTATELDNERLSWSSNNDAGAFGSPLKLPVAGFRDAGNIYFAGSQGYYWSRNNTNIDQYDGRSYSYWKSIDLAFHSPIDSGHKYSSNRDEGISVRCIKD